MFERSLSSLIKGLRSHRGKDESKYVATLMEEIKHEIRSADMDIKAEAVLKLTYLQMLGYPPPNASFHMLEVMASPRYHLKQLGYLAASQCFNEDTDVLILATNLLKKDLRSSSPLEVSVALNGFSHIITPDLAQHLAPEIITLLTHTQPSIRKKALLVLYSVILHHPPALEMSLPRISEKLDDSDMGVVSATINIIGELARNDIDNAKLFLTLSPRFFHLLTTSTNNWMLIKIIKLFGVLTPLEPRLVRKLVPSITSIISTTPAMSLLYECIHTIIIGGMFVGPDGDTLAMTCVEKLAKFLDDDDQNLKYIALLALVKLIPTHPHLVALHQEEIFEAMEDDDLSIRLRALDLVSGMAGRNNFKAIVEHQLRHIESEKNISRTTAIASLKNALQGNANQTSPPAPWLTSSYRSEIISRILDLGFKNTYDNVIDFEWYVDVLITLAYLANGTAGTRIRTQLIDIASRVRGIRSHAISKLKQVLEDASITSSLRSISNEKQEFELLQASAWICGEYCQEVSYPPAIIALLINAEILENCSPRTVCMMLHNAVKLFAWWLLDLSKDWQDEKLPLIRQLTEEIRAALQSWQSSTIAEVEERAAEYQQLLLILSEDLKSFSPKHSSIQATGDTNGWQEGETQAKGDTSGPKGLLLLSPLFFGHTLGPIARKAQSKVVKPIQLDLEKWIVNPREVTILDPWEAEERHASAIARQRSRKSESNQDDTNTIINESNHNRQLEAKENSRLKGERLKRQQQSPFYIGSTHDIRENGASKEEIEAVNIDEIPIVQLQLDELVLPKYKNTVDRNDTEEKPAMMQEEEETPEEVGGNVVEVVRKRVSARKKKKGKAVREASLL